MIVITMVTKGKKSRGLHKQAQEHPYLTQQFDEFFFAKIFVEIMSSFPADWKLKYKTLILEFFCQIIVGKKWSGHSSGNEIWLQEKFGKKIVKSLWVH